METPVMNRPTDSFRRARVRGLVCGVVLAAGAVCGVAMYWAYWALAADPAVTPGRGAAPAPGLVPFAGATARAASAPAVAAGGALASMAPVDVVPREIERIPPGTVVADRAPPGWTHLVIKSNPRIADASRKDVSDLIARLATLLSSIIVADVRADPQAPPGASFCLARVAVGLATNVGGQATVVCNESYQRVGAKFGFLEASVLAAAEEQLAKMRCLMRSPITAVVQGEGVLHLDGQHHTVLVRYALLVDPRTGALQTLCWGLRPREDGRLELIGAQLHWLPPALVEDCQLHVDPEQFFLGMPNRMAFAMSQLPPGQKMLRASPELAALLAQPTYTPQTARALEAQLWQLLGAPAGAQ